MKTKSIIVSLAVLLTTLWAPLKAANLSVNNLSLRPGETAQLIVSMSNTETNLSGFQFKLELPQGVTILKNGNGKFQYSNGERIVDHSLTIRELNNGGYQFICYSMDGYLISGTSGELLTVTITADDSFTASENGTLSEIKVTDIDANKTTCNNVTFQVIIPQISATGISLNQSTLSFNAANQTATLTATVMPTNATIKSVTWTSSNTSVATVSSTGVVTAKTNGTATISATTTDGTNLTATCTVTVAIPIINFADANVKTICIANWDTDGDGELSQAEAAAVTDLGEAFKNNSQITSFDELQYFTGLNSIGYQAFQACKGLTSINIPNSVTSIGAAAFAYCSMASITIPNSVTSIGNQAFYECKGLTSIAVANGNTVYDSRNGCNAIIETASNTLILGCKNTIIPNSVTSIGSRAFYNCSGLTSINIPNSVTSFGLQAFGHCMNLTSINIPNSVASIGYSAFECCIGLTSITIPSSVTSIGGSAFNTCIGLTSITIPSSVTSIGNYAFMSCSSLTSVTVDIATPLSITSATFSDRANATLYVPAGSKAAYEAADYWKEFKEIVEIETTIDATGITLNQSTLSFNAANQTATLTATVMPDNATNKSVTWTSSNTAVATVDENGVVTAVANGTATITATTADGTNLTATCEVTITIPEEDTDISALDNVIYINKVEAFAGQQLTLSIKMKNTEGIQTLQFDLYLPEGVEVVKYEDDFELIELSLERTTARKMDQFSYNKMANGAYRILINSSRRYTFDGNDGEIATVVVNINAGTAEGDYPIILRDIEMVTAGSMTYETPYVKSTLNISAYMPGDVNGDNRVSATDLNAIVRYILEQREFPFTFIEKAGDLNGDNKISATDVNIVTKMILNGTSSPNQIKRRQDNDDIFIGVIEKR